MDADTAISLVRASSPLKYLEVGVADYRFSFPFGVADFYSFLGRNIFRYVFGNMFQSG